MVWRAVDGALLILLSALTAQQSQPKQTMMQRIKQFLDDYATEKPAILTHCKSSIVFWHTARQDISMKEIHKAEGEDITTYQRMSLSHQQLYNPHC